MIGVVLERYRTLSKAGATGVQNQTIEMGNTHNPLWLIARLESLRKDSLCSTTPGRGRSEYGVCNCNGRMVEDEVRSLEG